MHPKLLKEIIEAADSQGQMLHTILNADPALQKYKQDPHSWNLLEVGEHCKNIETSILINLIKYQDFPSRNSGMRDHYNAFLLKVAMKAGFRFKVPPIKNLLPVGNLTVEEVADSWRKIRNELLAYLEVFPEHKINHTVFKHPRAGYLTIVQTIDFINDHTLHHQNQLKRITSNYKSYIKSKI
ncbi:MAG: DinB family protein [Bacteroidota bacterium]|nr:DinB family protein [Bacteroidota bacterium]